MIPRPERIELRGGGRIIAASNPGSPFLSIQGSLPGGTSAERPGEEGVARFLSRMLLSGTRARATRHLAEALEGLGATLEFVSTDEALRFHARCTRRNAGKVLGILADCLANPILPAKEVERVRTEILTEIREERDDTRALAERELLSVVYPAGHPYGRDPKGDEERVKAIEPGVLLDFHDRCFGRSDLIVALAGDVDAAFVRSSVEPALEGLPSEGAPPRPLNPPERLPPDSRFVDLPHKSQADVALGLQAIPRRHPDFYRLALANLLFGVIGMYGRLGVNLREEQGLAYYSFSRLRTHRAGGHWEIVAGVNPVRLEAALAGIGSELDRLHADPFSDGEVEDGKLNQVGGLVVGLERNAEVAAALHEIEFHDLGPDYLERYPSIVGSLTREDIVRAAAEYFRRADLSLVVVGPIGERTFSL